MSRRTERVGNLIRRTIGQILLRKLSDPRVDPACTSVTRVEVAEDLLTAKVYVSVLGTEADERRTLSALRHASGHVQQLMMEQITLRHTPLLTFAPDARLKKTLETLRIIQEAMDELSEEQGADDAGAASGESP